MHMFTESLKKRTYCTCVVDVSRCRSSLVRVRLVHSWLLRRSCGHHRFSLMHVTCKRRRRSPLPRRVERGPLGNSCQHRTVFRPLGFFPGPKRPAPSPNPARLSCQTWRSPVVLGHGRLTRSSPSPLSCYFFYKVEQRCTLQRAAISLDNFWNCGARCASAPHNAAGRLRARRVSPALQKSYIPWRT